MSIWSEAGLKLKRLRTLRGRHMSQRRLGELSGVNYATISLLEAGQSRAQPDTLAKLAPCLGVPVEDLLRLYSYPVSTDGRLEGVFFAAADPLHAAQIALSHTQWPVELQDAIAELLTHINTSVESHAAIALRFDRAVRVLWPPHGETPMDPATGAPLSEPQRLALLRDWLIDGKEATVVVEAPRLPQSGGS